MACKTIGSAGFAQIKKRRVKFNGKLNTKVTHTLTYIYGPLRGSHIHPPSGSWRRKGRNYGRMGRSFPLTHRSETRSSRAVLRRMEKRINPLRSRAKKKRAMRAARSRQLVKKTGPDRERGFWEDCSKETAAWKGFAGRKEAPALRGGGGGNRQAHLLMRWGWGKEGRRAPTSPPGLSAAIRSPCRSSTNLQSSPPPELLPRGCSPARLPEPRSRGRSPFVLPQLSSRAHTFLQRQRPGQPPLLSSAEAGTPLREGRKGILL